MERTEMGKNRDRWIDIGGLRDEQGQEESRSLPASEEGSEYEQGGACCHCKEKETCGCEREDCSCQHCCGEGYQEVY